MILALAAALSLGLAGTSAAGDWPTHRGDPARSGIARTELQLPLAPAWTWRGGAAPRPAWPGPAKRDAYNKVENLEPRLWFDRAHPVVVADGALFFGSSAEDRLVCLDANTGAERWSFFAEGPVRFAPTWWRNRIYFGSDDGNVYCLDAKDGEERWRHRPAPEDRRVPGNGRMISLWPIRSSVVVEDGTAYCSAGLFPSEGVYLTALSARNGREEWKHELEGLVPQGYLLAGEQNLYLPISRAAPVVFERSSGKRLRNLAGAGGTWALLVGENRLIHGPGRTGELSESSGNSAEQVASFSGTRMIVRRSLAWLHTSRELTCLDRGHYLELLGERSEAEGARTRLTEELATASPGRAEELQEELVEIGRELQRLAGELRACVRWRIPCDEPFDLILSGELLFAGGDDVVAAYGARDGEERWRAPVEGRAYSLAAARGALFVSTDRGTIHAFTEAGEGEAR